MPDKSLIDLARDVTSHHVAVSRLPLDQLRALAALIIEQHEAIEQAHAALEASKMQESWVVAAQGTTITMRVPLDVIQQQATARDRLAALRAALAEKGE